MIGVDDAFALAIGERELDGARIGGVDHHRRFDFADELIVKRRNVFYFVAVGALQANVNDVRAAFHLAAGDFGGFFPLFGGDQTLELARADYVGAFADDQRPRAFFRLDHFDAGIDGAMIRIGRTARLFAFGHLRDGANVLLGGAAAAADHIQPAAIDETVKLLGERIGSFLISAFFVGQAGVRIAGDEAICQRLQRANVVGHELGAGGAIQAERKQFHDDRAKPRALRCSGRRAWCPWVRW